MGLIPNLKPRPNIPHQEQHNDSTRVDHNKQQWGNTHDTRKVEINTSTAENKGLYNGQHNHHGNIKQHDNI